MDDYNDLDLEELKYYARMFTIELPKHSISKIFEEAKYEWDFLNVYNEIDENGKKVKKYYSNKYGKSNFDTHADQLSIYRILLNNNFIEII